MYVRKIIIIRRWKSCFDLRLVDGCNELNFVNRWETDENYCNNRVMRPNSEYYHGTLEFTETAIFDFLMGMIRE